MICKKYYKQWRSQPKHFLGEKIWGAKMFDFRRTTLFCLGKRFSKHKMTIFSKNVWGGIAPLDPPGHAYEGKPRRFYLTT